MFILTLFLVLILIISLQFSLQIYFNFCAISDFIPIYVTNVMDFIFSLFGNLLYAPRKNVALKTHEVCCYK